MNRFLIALLFCTSVYADSTLKICTGEYALCAASPTTPTGKTIQVNGRTYKEGMAVCPVLTGEAVANMTLMHNSCKAPAGKVWSLFGIPPLTSFPQAPTWAVLPAPTRTFIIGDTPETQMSNMWSFLCSIQAQPINGAKLASCYGPIMESPFGGDRVKKGEMAVTQAPAGATYAVGGDLGSK